KQRKLNAIKSEDLPEATWYATINLWLAESFRWALLIASALVTILAALKEFGQFKENVVIGISLIVLGALSTLVSAASTQFDFRRIKRLYDQKVSALKLLMDQLEYSSPAKDPFLAALARVISWTADTKDSDLTIVPLRASEEQTQKPPPL